MTDSQFIYNTIEKGNSISSQYSGLFTILNESQLNWKLSADKWSVGQCLDHLNTTHETYFPVLEKLNAGTYRPSVWARINPLSKWTGKKMVETLAAEVKHKFKAPGIWVPSQSSIPSTICEEFTNTHHRLMTWFEGLKHLDLDAIIVSSPASRMVTYSLRNMLSIIVHHEERHLRQAKRVMESPGFPIKP